MLVLSFTVERLEYRQERFCRLYSIPALSAFWAAAGNYWQTSLGSSSRESSPATRRHILGGDGHTLLLSRSEGGQDPVLTLAMWWNYKQYEHLTPGTTHVLSNRTYSYCEPSIKSMKYSEKMGRISNIVVTDCYCQPPAQPQTSLHCIMLENEESEINDENSTVVSRK